MIMMTSETAMRARDVMTREVVTIRPDASILEAARLMLEHRISGLPVVDEGGTLVGIVSERDLLRRDGGEPPEWVELLIGAEQLERQYAQSRTRAVAEVMTADPATIAADAPLEKAVRLMEQHRIKRLPVMADGRLVGIIARPDLVRAFASGLIRPPATEDAARRARMVELEKHFWTHRTKP